MSREITDNEAKKNLCATIIDESIFSMTSFSSVFIFILSTFHAYLAFSLELQDHLKDEDGARYTITGVGGSGSYGNIFFVQEERTKMVSALKLYNTEIPSNATERALLSNQILYNTCDSGDCGDGLMPIRSIKTYTELKTRDAFTGILMPKAEPLSDFSKLRLNSALGRFGVTIEAVNNCLQAIAVVSQAVGKALATFRKLGLHHNDIKPSNIVILSGEPVLTDYDFVSAKSGNPSFEVGSLVTSAPEIFQGKRRPKSDIFALGVSVFSLMTNLWPQSLIVGFEDHNLNVGFYQKIYDSDAYQFRKEVCQELASLRQRVFNLIKGNSQKDIDQVMELYDSLSNQVKDAVRVSHFLRKWSPVSEELLPDGFDFTKLK